MEPSVLAFVPAHPGFFALEPCWEDGVATELTREPVVAWRMESIWDAERREWDTVTSPVTAESLNHTNLVQLPDGRVLVLGDCEFASEGEALAYVNEQAAAGYWS